MVERVTSGQEAVGFDPGSVRPLPSVYNVTGFNLQKSGSPRSVPLWQHVKLSYFSLVSCPRKSLVDDEDVKKPNKQRKQSLSVY